MKQIVDTNIIVRFLVRDNEEFFSNSYLWFKEAESGKRELLIKVVVVAEVCFVLESVYKKEHKEIALKMSGLLNPSFLEVEDRNIIQHAWLYYEKGQHFVDSFLLAWQEVNKGKILTFDKKLLKSTIK